MGTTPSAARAKHARALDHLADLKGIIERYEQSKPIGLHGDYRYSTNQVGVLVSDNVPHELHLVLGDVVHNLRASLDTAIFSLWLTGHRQLNERNVYCPIADTSEKFAKRVRELDCDVPGLANVLLPQEFYPGGAGADIYNLHQLDRTDKHRTLNLAVTSVTVSGLVLERPGPPGQPFRTPIEATTLTVKSDQHQNVTVGHLPRKFVAGQPLITLNRQLRENLNDSNMTVQLDIRILDNNLYAGFSLVSGLVRVADRVCIIIAQLERVVALRQG